MEHFISGPNNIMEELDQLDKVKKAQLDLCKIT